MSVEPAEAPEDDAPEDNAPKGPAADIVFPSGDDDFLNVDPEDAPEGEEPAAEGGPSAEEADAAREKTAVAMGWRPEDQWSGDKSGWVDHNTFMDRHDRRERYRAEREGDWKKQQEQELQQLRSTLESQSKRQTEERIGSLREDMRAAIEANDMEKLYALTREEKDLETQLGSPRQQQVPQQQQQLQYTQQVQGMVNTFDTRNSVILEQKGWRDRASAIATDIEAQLGPNPDPSFVFLETEKALRAEYNAGKAPSQAAPRRAAPFVENRASPVPTSGNAGSKGFAGLPADAQSGFKQLARMGAYSDDKKGRAEYAKDYSND